MSRPWFLFVLAAFVLAGCGGSGGDTRAEVESMIRTQLPDSYRQNTAEAVFVNSVTCVSKGKNEFDCVANVTGTNGVGGLRSFDLPVSATCDERNCTWRTD